MPLKEILRHSKLSAECRYDLQRLGHEYNTEVAPSIERSRLERSLSPTRRSKKASLCVTPLTKPVPHGNYTTSPVFNRVNQRSAPPDSAMSNSYTNFSAPKRKEESLPNISRAEEEHERILKGSDSKHANRARSAVAVREGTDAQKAYTEAFMSYTGRSPSRHELAAADQLTFIRDQSIQRDVIVDERTLSRLSMHSNKSEFYYLKRLPKTEPKQYPAFRKTMAPKMI